MDTGNLFEMIQDAGHFPCDRVDELDDKAGMAGDELEDWLKYSSATELAEAVEMVEDDLPTKASLMCAMGLIYMAKDETDWALQMYQQAMDIYELLGNKKDTAACCEKLGIIYLVNGKLHEAEQMYKKAIVIDKHLGNAENAAVGYSNLGVIYSTRCELGLAVEMYEKALKINFQIGCKEGLAREYCNLGQLYCGIGNTDKAGKYWKAAVRVFKLIGKPEMAEKIQERLSKI